MKRFLFLVALVVVALLPGLALAQDTPAQYQWYDLEHRLTIGATGRYQWNIQSGAEEFVAGPVVAYELTPHLTFVGNVLYGVDSKDSIVQLGLTIPLYGGK